MKRERSFIHCDEISSYLGKGGRGSVSLLGNLGTPYNLCNLEKKGGEEFQRKREKLADVGRGGNGETDDCSRRQVSPRSLEPKGRGRRHVSFQVGKFRRRLVFCALKGGMTGILVWGRGGELF